MGVSSDLLFGSSGTKGRFPDPISFQFVPTGMALSVGLGGTGKPVALP